MFGVATCKFSIAHYIVLLGCVSGSALVGRSPSDSIASVLVYVDVEASLLEDGNSACYELQQLCSSTEEVMHLVYKRWARRVCSTSRGQRKHAGYDYRSLVYEYLLSGVTHFKKHARSVAEVMTKTFLKLGTIFQRWPRRETTCGTRLYSSSSITCH